MACKCAEDVAACSDFHFHSTVEVEEVVNRVVVVPNCADAAHDQIRVTRHSYTPLRGMALKRCVRSIFKYTNGIFVDVCFITGVVRHIQVISIRGTVIARD
jgi:hypothetical protein